MSTNDPDFESFPLPRGVARVVEKAEELCDQASKVLCGQVDLRVKGTVAWLPLDLTVTIGKK